MKLDSVTAELRPRNAWEAADLGARLVRGDVAGFRQWMMAVEWEFILPLVAGIGVVVDERSGAPVIISVVDGSPADRAGMELGDRIIAVGGTDVTALERTLFLGEPDAASLKIWEANVGAHELGISLIRPGIRCSDICAQINEFFADPEKSLQAMQARQKDLWKARQAKREDG